MNGCTVIKAVGAVAVAAVLAFGSGAIASVVVKKPELPAQTAPVVEAKAPETKTSAGIKVAEVAPAAAPAAPATAPAATGPAPIGPLLAKANPEAGKKAATVCAACHSFDKGGPNKVGPNLYGIVGRKHAQAQGFAYSPAMKKTEDKTWTFDELNAYLYNPREHIPGNKMAFAGVKKDEDRANIITWLRTLSDSPVALPSK